MRGIFSNQKLSVLIASIISLVVAVSTLVTGFLGAEYDFTRLKSQEIGRIKIEANYWGKQIAEAMHFNNWALIESSMKPDLRGEQSLSYFAIEDQSGEIQVASDEELLGEPLQHVFLNISKAAQITSYDVSILELSNKKSKATISEIDFSAPVVLGKRLVLIPGSDRILQIRLDVEADEGTLGTVYFGYNINQIVQSLAAKKNFILISAFVIALLLGFIIFFVTSRILRPLEAVSSLLASYPQGANFFAEDLSKIDLSQVRSNSREITNLIDAFNAFKKVLILNVREMTDLRASAAVANTTQMLAHDLRRPFSLLKTGLAMLEEAKGSGKIDETLALVVPEVERAASSVQVLLGDLLEIGTKPDQIESSSTSVVSQIKDALRECSNLHPNARIDLKFDFNHRYSLFVDSARINRVFINIIQNAIQAMRKTGEIFIETSDVESNRQNFMKIKLRNSGSFVEPSKLDLVFDMFYSSNKTGGTGLGLAIVKQVVLAHGGSVGVNSSKASSLSKSWFEISITLPVSNERDPEALEVLQENFAEYAKLRPVERNRLRIFHQEDLRADDRREATMAAAANPLPDTTESKFARSTPTVKIAIIDDEPIYLNHLESLASKVSESVINISISLFEDASSFLEYYLHEPFDLVITDIDLGNVDQSGYDIVAKINGSSKPLRPFICVHSNHFSESDQKKALSLGADSFLPKPITQPQMQQLIERAVENIDRRYSTR